MQAPYKKTPYSIRPIIPRRLIVERHFSRDLLVDQQPFELAKIRLKYPQLDRCVLLPQKYTPPKYPHTIVERKGRLFGRSLNLLLDRIVQYEEMLATCLTFKSAGADRIVEMGKQDDNKQVIDPLYTMHHGPGARTQSSDRIWGAVTAEKAYAEAARTSELIRLGFPFTPCIGVNNFPRAINEHLARMFGEYVEYAQIVRAGKTTVRFDDLDTYPQIKLDPIEIAQTDALFIIASLRLARQGRIITWFGTIGDNRQTDGLFTDGENFAIETYRHLSEKQLLFETLWRSTDYFARQNENACLWYLYLFSDHLKSARAISDPEMQSLLINLKPKSISIEKRIETGRKVINDFCREKFWNIAHKISTPVEA